jgi:hypothetical protein
MKFKSKYDILQVVKSGIFLPYYRYMYENFAASDTEEFFKENLKSQPRDWKWRNKPVNYTYNSQKYRCPEWDMIDWHASIIMFGGSDMMGIGVDETETISSCLQKLTAIPTINLGISGSSMIFNLHNMLQYRAGNRPTPRAVFVLWPHHSRICFYEANWIEAYGHWNAHQGGLFDLYNNDLVNAEVCAIENSRMASIIWQDTKYISASLFPDTAEICNSVFLESVCECEYDSRDLQHTGPETNMRIAQWIATQL